MSRVLAPLPILYDRLTMTLVTTCSGENNFHDSRVCRMRRKAVSRPAARGCNAGYARAGRSHSTT